MPEAIGFILGFDPGGADRFGWSVCSAGADRLQRPLKTGLADDAWDALNQVKKQSRDFDLPGIHGPGRGHRCSTVLGQEGE